MHFLVRCGVISIDIFQGAVVAGIDKTTGQKRDKDARLEYRLRAQRIPAPPVVRGGFLPH